MDTETFQKEVATTKVMQRRVAEKRTDQEVQAQNFQAVIDSIGTAINMLMRFHAQHEPKVTVKNQSKVPTSIRTPDVQKVVDALENLKQPIIDNKTDNSDVIAAVQKVAQAIAKLPTTYPEAPEPVEEVTVKNQPDYTKQFEVLNETIKSLDVRPVINISKSKSATPDYTPIVDSLTAVLEAVKAIKIPKVSTTDLTPLVDAMVAVQNAITALRFPVPNYVLPFSSGGKATQVALNTNGSIPVSSTTSLIPVAYDSLTYTVTSGTVDTFEYFIGGTGGTLVATVTVTYTDSGHSTLVSVVRT